MAVCPECGEAVSLLDDMEAGEIIECDNCGLELEIISLNPIRLEIFEEEEK
jgi:alpha-aminoadipate carrier protein LysW